ncbi:uncharacterized protein LOC117555787 isoform X1 [Gymnodraco acuticeps]|uniref:Uncharacterized protein LOC117555787 isoform X1 n=1 Tax=Gymnodraco acuticeps TaxID=8218 RepID=A0A6P8WGV6_GYMAC|nr:uncharacterized protein LOC117555787 isoform X1 [Gymnodraco acuticeps]
MKMRRSKRKNIGPPRRFLSEFTAAKDSAGQPELEQPSSHTVAEETTVVHCSDGSDSDSTTGPQSTVTASNSSAAPTAIAALKCRNRYNNALKIRRDVLKDKLLSVESERDYLRIQLAEGHRQNGVRQLLFILLLQFLILFVRKREEEEEEQRQQEEKMKKSEEGKRKDCKESPPDPRRGHNRVLEAVKKGSKFNEGLLPIYPRGK